MPSTYSNLKFELISTGEQSGTWGATTNSNIGIAIEQAICGMATLTSGDFTANVATLTLSNTTAAQDARAFCLVIAAGAVGAAGTVNVPAIEKQYLVVNNSSYTVTVKVSGQPGMAVPAGRSAFVYNDGTDVGQAADYLPEIFATEITSSGDVNAQNFIASGFARVGTYEFTETGGDLIISSGGTDLMKLDSSGNLTVIGDVTANGTI